MAKYTYEIPALLSIDADSDKEARAIAEQINDPKRTEIGRAFFDEPFHRTNIETGVTAMGRWPEEETK